MSRKHALIIGNSEYQDPTLARLVTPGEDVNDLAAVLRAPDIGEFDEVITLVNELSANVRLEIESFFAEKKLDDLLLMYFSGHGVRDDQGQLYLAVKDTRHDRLRATAIPAAFVTEGMDHTRSRRQVLALDCCHSGAFAQGAKGVTGESVGIKTAFEGRGYGRVVLTATDATQYAWEGDQVIGEAENSVFTHYMIEGLKTGAADIDGDGQITLDELYDYVYEQVVSKTPKQTPGKWSYKQQGEIVIAKNPHPIVKPAVLPADLQQATESPFAGVREGAIRELERLLNGSLPGLSLASHEALQRLADDDSRRVAGAASDVLKAYAEAAAAREREKTEAERLATQKAEAERIAREKAEQERAAKEKAEAERLAAQKAEQERLAQKLAEIERAAREKAEQERLAKEKAEAERLAVQKAEAERIAREKTEQERLTQEKAEAERLAAQKPEQRRPAKEKPKNRTLALVSLLLAGGALLCVILFCVAFINDLGQIGTYSTEGPSTDAMSALGTDLAAQITATAVSNAAEVKALNIEGGLIIGSLSETRIAISDKVPLLLELVNETFSANELKQVNRTFTYTVQLSQEKKLIWSRSWCATTQDILQQNLSNMRFEFYVNGSMINLGQFLSTKGQSSQSGVSLLCQDYTAVIYNWPTGKTALEDKLIFSAMVNDGMDDYPVGTQTFVYVVMR